MVPNWVGRLEFAANEAGSQLFDGSAGSRYTRSFFVQADSMILKLYAFSVSLLTAAALSAAPIPIVLDGYGDALPKGAIHRLGTGRYMAPGFGLNDATRMAIAPEGDRYAYTGQGWHAETYCVHVYSSA